MEFNSVLKKAVLKLQMFLHMCKKKKSRGEQWLDPEGVEWHLKNWLQWFHLDVRFLSERHKEEIWSSSSLLKESLNLHNTPNPNPICEPN